MNDYLPSSENSLKTIREVLEVTVLQNERAWMLAQMANETDDWFDSDLHERYDKLCDVLTEYMHSEIAKRTPLENG